MSDGIIPTIKILGGSRSQGLYTLESIKHFCLKFNIPITENIDNADFVWFSCCDPDDLPKLLKLRKGYPDKKVIMGGFESYFALPYFAWVDYVVVGEGFEFIKAWGEDYEKALSLDCVMKSPDDTAKASYYVPWKEFPLLKVTGRNRFFYLAGKGCRRRCKFCATSWVQPHQEASKVLIKRVLNEVEQKPWGAINLISNDSGRVYESKAINSQSVTVDDYLREPKRYKSKMLHFGVEGWTEAQRKEYGKPLSNEKIRSLLEVTKRNKQACELFFIVGHKDWHMGLIEEFAKDCLPVETSKHPKVHVKLTYFDPVPHTPLGCREIKLRYCNPKKVFGILSGYSQRVRVFPTRSAARSAWRGVFHRCNPEEAERIKKAPNDTNTAESFDAFLEYIADAGLEHRLTTTNDKYKNVSLYN